MKEYPTKLPFRRSTTLPWIVVILVAIYLSRKYNTCHLRMPITYALLALSVGTMLQVQAWVPLDWALRHRRWFLPIFFVAIALIFAVHFTRANSPLKILSYLFFVLAMSIILSPLFHMASYQGVLQSSLFTVIALFLVLSIFSFWKPDWIQLKWAPFLFIGLVALLLMRLSFWIWTPSLGTYRMAAYIGILIFSAYVLYDTKRMMLRAQQCGRKYDYVTNLIGLFIDFMNLFANRMALSTTRH